METTFQDRSISQVVREKIESGGERIWRARDFVALSGSAVAQTLSRLRKEGVIERIGKGLYYRPRQTIFGKSRPNPSMIRALVGERAKIFPAGLSAANFLGFTTQNPAKAQLATTARSVPRLLRGDHISVQINRPVEWENLSPADAAILEFLRLRGEQSELPEWETLKRLLSLLSEDGRFERLFAAAHAEPARVRAMLGALGEQLGAPSEQLKKLRDSLNPLTRFNFGALSGLVHATRWQAKARRREAL